MACNVETGEDNESSKVLSNTLPDVKLFKRRWLQLALFIACSTMNHMQLFQYTVSSNIMQKYWGVSSLAIQWTSMSYMVAYLLTVFPATHLMGRVGLRWTCLIAAAGTCLGSWIKVFSTSPDRFAVTFIGQTIVALSQTFIISSPGQLAAYWFGPKEVALATALACYGIQGGMLIGFAATTRSIKNHDNIADIGDDLHKYFITLAIVCTVVFALVLFFFLDEPPLPPSITRALQKTNHETGSAEGFWPPVKRIVTNRSFIMVWNSYGIIVSINGAMGTVANPLYLAHFENGEVEVGNLGVMWTIFGTIGATLSAFILDHTKKFRMIATTLCIFTLLFQITFAIGMINEVKWLVFVSGSMWGVFMIGYAAMGPELCSETTYPEAEGLAMGILNIANQIYGTMIILITGRMIEMYGDKAGHACLIGFLAFGTALVIFSKLDLRRSKAARVAQYNDVSLQLLKLEKTGRIEHSKREFTDGC